MPGPVPKTRTTLSGSSCGLRLIVASLVAAVRTVDAQECPAATPGEFDFAQLESAEGAPIEFQADALEASRDGSMLLKGDVLLTQGVRTIRTRDARYDTKTQRIEVDAGVEYSDPALKVSGAGARAQPGGGVEFSDAQFELRSVNARGGAEYIRATARGEIEFRNVRYTTCPVGNEDWVLRAADIDIDQQLGLGVGRGVRLDFKGVPLLYAPLISFPVGDERKSGFLFPTFGSSSSSGYSLSAPWYWNIAPNYDATLTPIWYTRRGLKLDTEFRYLSSFGRGAMQAEYLPDDQEFGADRSLFSITDQSDFTDQLRLDVQAANVSDSRWFEDFGLGPEGTSVTYLNRVANLTFLSERWLAVLRTQNFQTIDDSIAREDRPHTLLPQITIQGEFPDQFAGLAFGLDLELGNFEHSLAAEDSGWRLDVAPEIRMPLRGAGLYLEPVARWRYTTYSLDDENRSAGDSPSRSAPIFSVDGGLVFEREQGSRKQRLQTLEPRFMYLYVPYRNQDDLPVFDTALPDLNLVQLFRTNRYVGADRLSNANQLSIGLTSRLLDAASGRQFVTATVGQSYYFDAPRVGLPSDPDQEFEPTRDALEDTESSDIIAELGVAAYENWNIAMGVQWDPGDTRSERGDVRLQYQPAPDQVANLSYRFRRGAVEQVDASTAWPVNERWSAYGRVVYSLDDSLVLDQFAGLEYRSCCWRLRLLGRRYVSDRTGDRDTSVLLQLELNGLSSVGTGADAFLERSIRGYSLGSPELQLSR